MKPLRVPCSYQGGKQRIAGEIAEVLLDSARGVNSQFFDLCCGSGAISIELINKGVSPERITMLDISSWGTFWEAVGRGSFRMEIFQNYLEQVPQDKRLVKEHMMRLSQQDPGEFEAEIYPILQSCSFGGKQIWWRDGVWHNAFFRDYWHPTETSIRRSPANPMHPKPEQLQQRIAHITERMSGITAMHADITTILDGSVPRDAVFYVDPPYQGTTSYGFNFNVITFAETLRERTSAPIFVSEGRALSSGGVELKVRGANGGISGNRVTKHREWLTLL